MTLETITGNLKDGYKQLQSSTMLHVDELMNERRTNEELRSQWFYTADGAVYFLDGTRKTPTLAITRENHNPVLKNIDDAFAQLTTTGNYSVLPHDFEQVLAAPDTMRIALPKLRLQGDNAEWRYLEIRTEDGFVNTGKKYEAPREEEQKVKERFGYTSENLAMLRTSPQKIEATRLHFLNPEYVQQHAKQGAIARASWLDDFDYDSRFSASVRIIDDRNRVRGVCREVVAEGGAQKNQGGPYRTPAENRFKAHYDAILADTEGAVKALNDERAAGLSQLVSKYLSTRGQ